MRAGQGVSPQVVPQTAGGQDLPPLTAATGPSDPTFHVRCPHDDGGTRCTPSGFSHGVEWWKDERAVAQDPTALKGALT